MFLNPSSHFQNHILQPSTILLPQQILYEENKEKEEKLKEKGSSLLIWEEVSPTPDGEYISFWVTIFLIVFSISKLKICKNTCLSH